MEDPQAQTQDQDQDQDQDQAHGQAQDQHQHQAHAQDQDQDQTQDQAQAQDQDQYQAQDQDQEPPSFDYILTGLAANSPEITVVRLDQRGLGDAEVVALCDALAENTQVSELSLTRNEFSTAGLVAIAKLLSKSCISHLDLSHNTLAPAGVTPLAKAISSNIGLRSIQLRSCGAAATVVLMAFMQRPTPPAPMAMPMPMPMPIHSPPASGDH